MKRLLLLAAASALIALAMSGAASAKPIDVDPALATCKGILPKPFNNAPTTVSGFDEDCTLTLFFGDRITAVNGTASEHYWLTNTGDPIKKPKLTLTTDVSGMTFVNATTGARTTSVDLGFGETINVSRENQTDKEVHVIKYASLDNVPPPTPPFTLPVATTAVLGGIKSGGDLSVASTGLATIAPAASPSLSGLRVVFKPDAARIIQSSSSSQNAPKLLDYTSMYLQLGEREYGTSSYRLIGFGFRYLAKDPPGFIGYQETNAGGGTLGDIIMGGRTGTDANADPLLVNFRVRADGQLLAKTGYSPTTALSLANKGYVDGLVNTVQPGVVTVTVNATVTPTSSELILMINAPTTTMTLGAQPTTGGLRAGSTMDIINRTKVIVPVTFRERLDTPTMDNAGSIQMPPGKTFRCGYLTSPGWICWQTS